MLLILMTLYSEWTVTVYQAARNKYMKLKQLFVKETSLVSFDPLFWGAYKKKFCLRNNQFFLIFSVKVLILKIQRR